MLVLHYLDSKPLTVNPLAQPKQALVVDSSAWRWHVIGALCVVPVLGQMQLVSENKAAY